MNRQEMLLTGLAVLLLSALLVPAAGAVTPGTGSSGSQGSAIQDSAELLVPLKMHTAYVGKTQQVRMDGVITYIDRISSGTGTAVLQQIEEDYLTAAFPVPVLRTVDEITTAREEMRRQSILFADETGMQLAKFNGSTADLQSGVNAALRPVEESSTPVTYSSWLASQATRSAVFNQSAGRRAAVLEELTLHGVDTTRAENLSMQIGAHQAELEDALLHNRNGELVSIQGDLKLLKQQFHTTVEKCQTDLQVQMKAAEMMR